MDDVDMETSPSYFDPEDLSIRERYRRYGKRHSASSLSPQQHESTPSGLGEIRSNSALFLENIKQEVESLDIDHGGTPSKTQNSSKRRSSIYSHGASEADYGDELIYRGGIHSLKICKQEEDAFLDSGDTTFSLFASLLDSALQGA